ncbi:A24 family peptidase [Thermosediminibacter litoriperuensis]|uniref:Prepilin peptidase CpaA n=1 Tax=Thermosediminibacter litoriperuensis TaxID=291989 RepID=A0A5S5AR32_9FIRM|nr:prepilin peptidase [Thermosediminibacter litoriperuensis]TYP53768.1 prepilin peptidase CpaA [Thermosediminibacter litoriperuensis]
MVLDAMLFAVLGISVYTDLKYNKIFNAVLAPAAAAALLGNLYLFGAAGGLDSLKGMMLGMAFLFVPFALGGMGGGDVKLMGVVGAFKGPGFVWTAFICSALAGGLLSLGVMAAEGRLLLRLRAVFYTFLSILGVMPRGLNLLGHPKTGSTGSFPYGVAIAAGTILAYFLAR